ncbi:MAG TPA: phenylalanine--tRNA ligase beta subunit-related protein [Candidatus Xenobia bacterium]
MLTLAPHPLLDAAVFTTRFSSPLRDQPSPAWLRELLKADAPAPFHADDATRTAIRALLRHGGFKPSGRSKPASEYLQRAVSEGALDSINAAVDACNVVSLHSGIPISVVDLDLAREPYSIRICDPGETYVFNSSGQSIDLAGLVCLCDAEGPCGNAVKDSQRTKTTPDTTRTLSILWSHQDLSGYAGRVATWHRELLERLDARTSPV